MKTESKHLETLAVHAGQTPDPTTGAVSVPVYYTSTYAQSGPGEHKGFEYSRTHNLTRFALEANLASLEGGHAGLCFASGLAATATLLEMFDAGTHVVACDDLYGGTFRLFDKVFRRFGFEFSYVDPVGGAAAIEAAAKAGGHELQVPFKPGRTDATQAQTDAASFAFLEPKADGFRNYVAPGMKASPAEMLVDRANLLTLTAPEMTALVGGLRVLGANVGGAAHGVFTHHVGALTNDFFVNLLDMGVKWSKSAGAEGVLEGRSRADGALRWTGTVVDLVFGSNAQLRAIAEVYASDDGRAAFVKAFVAAWVKVMEADRF